MIRVIVDKPQPVKWGEFDVRKTYRVSNPDGTPANGYIIQQVEKRTIARTPNGKEYKTTAEILELTSGNVSNASDTYYEIFPIINGTTCKGVPTPDRENCIDDQFQNSAIARYTFESDVPGGEKTWGVDDDPPTAGTITMIGVNVFVPTTKDIAESLYDKIQSNSGGTITLNGISWTLSKRTPADGLPFSPSFPLFSTFIKDKPVAIHTVNVQWDNKGNTTVQSSLSGGKRRRKRTIRGRAVSKSYRKLRTGKTTRRSRGRV